MEGAATLEAEVRLLRAVAVERGAADPGAGGRCLDDHRPGAVAEEHTGRAIVPVQKARDRLRAHEQDLPRGPRQDEAAGHREAVDEASARGPQIEDRGTPRAEALLDETRSGGQEVVRRCRRDDDRIEILAAHARSRERFLRGLRRHDRGDLVSLDDVSLADPGALVDPRVGRVHDGLEVRVRQHLRRNVEPPTGDDRLGGHRRRSTGSPRSVMQVLIARATSRPSESVTSLPRRSASAGKSVMTRS